VQFGDVSRDSSCITIEVGEKNCEDVNHIDLAHVRQSRFHEEKEILGQLNNHKCLMETSYPEVSQSHEIMRIPLSFYGKLNGGCKASL
jgi:hypothetical protein